MVILLGLGPHDHSCWEETHRSGGFELPYCRLFLEFPFVKMGPPFGGWFGIIDGSLESYKSDKNTLHASRIAVEIAHLQPTYHSFLAASWKSFDLHVVKP